MVSQVLSYYSNLQTHKAAEANIGKDHSLTYVLGFAALGIFVTITAMALGMHVAAS